MSHATVTDRKLPGLTTALDAAAMQERLRPLVGARGDLQVSLHKHVTGKRAVLFFRFADGQRLVGKMYRKDRSVEQRTILWALHEVLQNGTRTPRPLACWQDLGLVIQEHMPGDPAPHWSELSGDGELVARLGRALAELHRAPLPVGRHTGLEDHLRRACHPGLDALREALPHLGARLREIETTMRQREQDNPVDRVVSHGDFGPGQVLLNAHQVSLVDLDGLSHSDAALDVTNFTVGLRVHAGLAARDLTQRFLDAYHTTRGTTELQGAAHYEAFACLRRAMILLRKRPAGWEEQALQLVGWAGDSLSQ